MIKYIFIAFMMLSLGLLKAQKLDNMLYPFNNSMRTMPAAPNGMDAQTELLMELGYQGFEGHFSESYFKRRKSLDKGALQMPVFYLLATINKDGSVSYLNELKNIIKDSKNRNLLIGVAVQSEHFKNNLKEGDKYLVKTLQLLADYAQPFGVKIAVYPHANFYCERLDHSIKLAKKVDRPNVGAIFNTCHFFKVEGMKNWQQKLKDATPYLYMISINGLDEGDTKSMTWKQLIQPLGEGSFDTYQVIKTAKDNGYKGVFGLQCYKINQDCKAALAQSMNTWEQYRKKYKKEE
ncbi:sugar phosphate isomerase/epimerase family protein [Labilibacter marinus]|uniref:sugar phosphate isomerase/epimerase family protein n=1 Tax=Labilibacter marinus TaxID=1477105 RepID=UPI00082D0836|nr:TIM barrel protein [Labilibacter marinus]